MTARRARWPARRAWLPAVLLLSLWTAGCGGSGSGTGPGEGGWPPQADAGRDIVATDLQFNLLAQTARAEISWAAASRAGASLEVGDLQILAVRVDGQAIRFQRQGDRLDLGIGPDAVRVQIDYGWQVHEGAGGVAGAGSTLTWPQACGALFPCHSAPADGSRFSLALTGVPPGQVAVYPARIDSDAPAYQLAWAIGPYQRTVLGRTAAGTQIVRWNFADEDTVAAAGTAELVAAFDWLERQLGAYRFGAEAGSVAVHGALGGLGGMEHHPLWHVGAASLGDRQVHIHEAAHGWFGAGVRLACWEDLVLSEGAATYYEARVLEDVAGAAAGHAAWARLDAEAERLRRTGGGTVARPPGCAAAGPGAFFSRTLYVKGALYLRALEQRLTRPVFDRVMRRFYERHAGQAAGIDALVAEVAALSAYDATACTRDWLQREALPVATACP